MIALPCDSGQGAAGWTAAVTDGREDCSIANDTPEQFRGTRDKRGAARDGQAMEQRGQCIDAVAPDVGSELPVARAGNANRRLVDEPRASRVSARCVKSVSSRSHSRQTAVRNGAMSERDRRGYTDCHAPAHCGLRRRDGALVTAV